VVNIDGTAKAFTITNLKFFGENRWHTSFHDALRCPFCPYHWCDMEVPKEWQQQWEEDICMSLWSSNPLCCLRSPPYCQMLARSRLAKRTPPGRLYDWRNHQWQNETHLRVQYQCRSPKRCSQCIQHERRWSRLIHVTFHLRRCLCRPPCSQHFGAQYSTCTTLEIRWLFDLLAQLTMPSPMYCPCSHWIQPPLPQPYVRHSGSIVTLLFPLYTVYSVTPVMQWLLMFLLSLHLFICMCQHCVPCSGGSIHKQFPSITVCWVYSFSRWSHSL
jgi:hypothetical protein